METALANRVFAHPNVQAIEKAQLNGWEDPGKVFVKAFDDRGQSSQLMRPPASTPVPCPTATEVPVESVTNEDDEDAPRRHVKGRLGISSTGLPPNRS